jgi:hypothetical protein
MRFTWMAIGALVALIPAAPATARPDAKPKVVSAWADADGGRTVRVVVKGRDQDDVVRGMEISWGEGQAEQGLSSCAPRDRDRRGKLARFELSYAYPGPGTYDVTVRVLSGGCGKRPQQRSAPRTITVRVD